MTTIIIAVVVIAIIAFLVVRSRQNKQGSTSAKGKSANKTTKKSEVQASAAPVAEVKAKPAIDLNVLIGKIDVLIADKEYAKAEALINQSLKQDMTLHALYEKLLTIYHGQEDDFAVKQLLDTLQKLNLNEVYQRVFNEHERFKEEQAKVEALNAEKKTPDVFEFTPSSTSNTADFDSLANDKPADNSLEFANLSDNTVTPTTQDTTLEFVAPATEQNVSPVTESPDLDFNLSAPAEPTPAVTSEPALDFKLDVPDAPVKEEPSLDFKLDVPDAPVKEEPTLDFKLDLDAPAVDAPKEAPSLDFKLDVPTSAPEEKSLDFSLDIPESTSSASPTLDLNLDSVISTPAQETYVPEAQPSTGQFADSNDPIVQSFSDLANVDPIDINLQLVEEYIRLGAFDAARNLLNDTTGEASPEQLSKIDGLLQKLAS